MKKIIWIQLIFGTLLFLIFLFAYAGCLIDVKYIIEETCEGNNAAETVYMIIDKLSLIFCLLFFLLVISSIFLLVKNKKQ